jgi:hypothetical protein
VFKQHLNLVLRPIACGEVMTEEAFNDTLTSVRLEKLKQVQDVMARYAGKRT